MELDQRRELYNGFGDVLARAFEFAVTPGIFAFLGLLLDRRLGTVPVFAVVFGLVTVVWMFVRTWMEYERQMQRQEADAPWGSGVGRAR